MLAAHRRVSVLLLSLICGLCLLLSACHHSESEEEAPSSAGVTVEVAQAAPLVVTTDLNGRLKASRVAEVRARVSGIVLKRLYQEGHQVSAGDTLFQIDPEPLQVEVARARAALDKAEANRSDAGRKAQRYERLINANAISRQDYESIRGLSQQADAEVASAKAELASARLKLGYATVTAPISGRIGPAQVTEGALVGQNEATLMATIQQLDPIYADITQPLEQYTAIRQAGGEGDRIDGTDVMLIQPGDEARAGQLLFSDTSVDQGTGQVTLRSAFANADQSLLPGAFVQVRVPVKRLEKGLTVAQRAVQRDGAGEPVVMIVNDEDRIEKRTLTLGGVHDGRWIVLNGLKEGDRVVTSGLQQVSPGMSVNVESGSASEPSAGSSP
ncbi:resistance-nodulation-cell division (RND) multidrug efflux membrane fusion protein MexC [Kushneria pakistanensis]|uniref:Resistance-nodulation-cell division (RND) multidrug efflux membrane fusion protein MexC n=1 Tax=Kushneria pakistanensis TaxID=1508770 RepID=A0ABQ3FQM0_9GAMM|nr:efflux RND transporter periplasmic adaptor subunit [Kushneria pakistanensis]GHC33005.1 resistance-nodulation-cell division (RND) multidrug efflux membrane fusion protein MexC [Kushneria pakistanensis]